MTPKISLITAVVGAALVLAAPAWGDNWGADRQDGLTVVGSPDLVDRAVAARQNEVVTNERAGLYSGSPDYSAMLDARRRVFAAMEEAVNRPNVTTPAATETSGREIEWPQIGIGFGVGVLLMLGLFVALRATHIRQLAH